VFLSLTNTLNPITLGWIALGVLIGMALLVAIAALLREFVLRFTAARLINASRMFCIKDKGPTDDEAVRDLGVTHAFTVHTTGPRPARLSTWVVDPQPDAPRPAVTALILHGIGDRKESLRPFALRLSKLGYRAVLVDLRAHGRSTGRHVTFGVRDANDLQNVLDELERRELLTSRFAVLGASYGSACAVQLASRDERVDRVCLVTPFSSMRAVVPNYVRMYAPLGLGRWMWPGLVNKAVDRAGRMADFDPDEADTQRKLAELDMPVLLIHGDADEHVDLQHSLILDRCAPHARLSVVAGADHFSIYEDRFDADVFDIIAAFLAEERRPKGLHLVGQTDADNDTPVAASQTA